MLISRPSQLLVEVQGIFADRVMGRFSKQNKRIIRLMVGTATSANAQALCRRACHIKLNNLEQRRAGKLKE